MRVLTVMSAALLLAAGSAHAVVLDDFEGDTVVFINDSNISGHVTSLTHSTEAVYAGAKALELVDGASGYPYIRSAGGVSWGDLSADNTTYVEFAVRPDPINTFGVGQNTWMGNDGVTLYMGNWAGDKRTNWRVKEQAFMDVAPDANGWYLLHLELDEAGLATLEGTTLNGVSVNEVDLGQTWTMNGGPDWTAIDQIRILIAQGSGSLSTTNYIDGLILGPTAGPGVGDANADGVVDDKDLSLLLASWHQDVGWADGNFNGDDVVNDADLSLLLANWVGTGPVPEPATLAVLALGCLTAATRRRR